MALHFDIQSQTALAVRFLRKNSDSFILSELAELECRRAFAVRSGKPNSENWARLQGVIESGAWHREPMDWAAVSERANQLIDRFGARLKAGTLDTLHVAHALHSGCTRFLSFDTDSNARTLAASCKLKVYPEMTAEEKGRLLR